MIVDTFGNMIVYFKGTRHYNVYNEQVDFFNFPLHAFTFLFPFALFTSRFSNKINM